MIRATSIFPSYDRIRDPLSPRLWMGLRIFTLCILLLVAALLLLRPKDGLVLFWGLIIPAVPAIVVLAPGFWRQVCPLALANQAPKLLGISRGGALPDVLHKYAYTFAVISFFVIVAMRRPLFNTSGAATAAMAFAAFAAAFAGGYFFKGRSGWCGTFCPLGAIQRNYGHAPAILIPNGHCEVCVGCQKNCYDLNPQAAVFDDLNDEDPRYAGQRKFFLAMMPGMLLGYFGQLDSQAEYLTYAAMFAVATVASVGLFYFLTSFGRVSEYRACVFFSALAVAEFYWFAAPIVATSIDYFAGGAPTFWLVWFFRTSGLLLGLILLAHSLWNERQYEAARAEDEARQRAKALAEGRGACIVRERSSGREQRARNGETLLHALQSAGAPVTANCRSGLCGADAVAILEGADSLNPPSDDEKATLKRLGYGPGVRLACMCQVGGDVVVDANPAKSAAPSRRTPKEGAAQPLARLDKALRLHTGGAIAARRTDARHTVVVIGNGAAGATLAQHLRDHSAAWRIMILGAEPSQFYNRMALGKVVSGKLEARDLLVNPPDWGVELDIETRCSARVVAIERKSRSVTLLSGERIRYDHLVLANGANARAPAAGFLARGNCFSLRTLSDATMIHRHAHVTGARRAVVIGGGVQGVEAAEALRSLGLETTIVHSHSHLMNQQLDEQGGRLLESYLERSGVRAVTGARIAAYHGGPVLKAIELKNGAWIEADLFVACAGTSPNAELGRACGLAAASGILVDAHMRSSDPSILAIGDVADTGGGPAGLWPVALAQARCAAQTIIGEPEAYQPSSQVVQLKSDGLDVIAYGNLAKAAGAEIIASPALGEMSWKIAVRDGKIVAGQYIGLPGRAASVARLFRSQVDIGAHMETLRAGRLDAVRVSGG